MRVRKADGSIVLKEKVSDYMHSWDIENHSTDSGTILYDEKGVNNGTCYNGAAVNLPSKYLYTDGGE